MNSDVHIQSVSLANLDKLGFFCYKSKRKTPGYQKKLAWLQDRFGEGMRIYILYEGGVSKAFIEAIPGQHAWRAVSAAGYLFVHCLWVVGKAKGKGYGSRLLERCMDEARAGGFAGLAMLTSRSTWLVDEGLLLHNGFELVGTAPPSFSLVVRRFGRDPGPSLPTDWDERCRRYGPGLTVVTTDQCPYIDRMKSAVYNVGRQMDIPVREVHLASAAQVQREAPSPYGTYGIIYNGRLVSYHPIGTDDLLKRMARQIAPEEQ